MQWLKDDFLGYLQEWESSVKTMEGFEPAEKKMMLLTAETLLGIQITGILK